MNRIMIALIILFSCLPLSFSPAKAEESFSVEGLTALHNEYGNGESKGIPLLRPVYEEDEATGETVVSFIVQGLITPVDIFYKVFTGEEDLSYVLSPLQPSTEEE